MPAYERTDLKEILVLASFDFAVFELDHKWSGIFLLAEHIDHAMRDCFLTFWIMKHFCHESVA